MSREEPWEDQCEYEGKMRQNVAAAVGGYDTKFMPQRRICGEEKRE